MIDFTTKKRIRALIPSQYTINGKVFNVNVLLANQYAEFDLPAIVLNFFSSDNIITESLNKVNGLDSSSVDDTVVTRGAKLEDLVSVNVFAETAQKVHGIEIADTIVSSLWKYFRYTFPGQLSEVGVFTDPTPIRELDNLSGTDFRYRRQFDVGLSYTVDEQETIPRIKRIDSTVNVETP